MLFWIFKEYSEKALYWIVHLYVTDLIFVDQLCIAMWNIDIFYDTNFLFFILWNCICVYDHKHFYLLLMLLNAQ